MVNKKIFTGYKVKPMKPYFPNFLLFFMKISHRSLPSLRPIRPIRPVPCAVAPPPPLRSIRSIRPVRFFRFRSSVAVRPLPSAQSRVRWRCHRPSVPSVLSVPSVAARPVCGGAATAACRTSSEETLGRNPFPEKRRAGALVVPALVKFFIVYLSPLIHI